MEADAVHRKRLRKKTVDLTVPKKRGRKKGTKKEGPSVRDRAVKSGLVPKARNAYALFTQSEMQKDEYVGLAWAVCAKKIGGKWKALDEHAKNIFKEKAKQ